MPSTFAIRQAIGVAVISGLIVSPSRACYLRVSGLHKLLPSCQLFVNYLFPDRTIDHRYKWSNDKSRRKRLCMSLSRTQFAVVHHTLSDCSLRHYRLFDMHGIVLSSRASSIVCVYAALRKIATRCYQIECSLDGVHIHVQYCLLGFDKRRIREESQLRRTRCKGRAEG